MTDMITEPSGHPEELLPWFVNKTLSTEEHHTVKQHLESCPQCQQEVALLQQMRRQIKETSTKSPGDIGLNRLLGTIRKDPTIPDVSQKTSVSWWQTGFAIAASLIIVIQAGLLIDAWYISKPVIPLTGSQEHGLVLQVSFTPSTTEPQMREVITAIHGKFIDGPSALGIYRIRIDNKGSSSESTIKKALEQLQQKPGIISHVTQE